MDPPLRFHLTDRWLAKWADAPEEIRETVDHILTMFAEDRWTRPGEAERSDRPTPILRTSAAQIRRRGELIAVLGDVLIRFFPPPDYPGYIILEDLLWVAEAEG